MNGVSVIIPAFNAATFLPDAIRSALEQTEPPKDVIVIDDGSTDETTEVCKPFKDRIFFERCPNRGVSIARNDGATRARGEWLIFLDADDVLLPHAIQALRASAINDDARVSYGFVLMRAERAEATRLHGYPFAVGEPPLPAARNFWRATVTTPGAAVVHRSLHEEVGGFVDGYQPMEDRDYWMKCGVLSRFAFADTCVLDKRWRPGSAASQSTKRIVNGLRAQLAFLDWGKARGVDISFLDACPRQIVNYAIKDAMWHRQWDALPAVFAIAQQHGVRTSWRLRAKFRRTLARLSGEG